MDSFKPETVFTVSQFTAALKDILESQYRFVRLCGEISNLKTPFSGHSYFTLKDAGAQIRAILFKQQKRFVDLTLQDGQQVVAFGRISVYEPRGEYQLVADSITLYGTGKLLQDFEQLKRKLADKGYFAALAKKSLPPFPEKIIIISSPTGAALQDFLKIVSNRKSPVHIQILPVKVQGKSAAAEIAGAIDKAQDIPGAEVIVLCRGGGSIEDLWAFNEEIVAEAIHRSHLPVVTGIGHETDNTIADFCADFRCPTPTAAAEKLVVDAEILRRHIQVLRDTIKARVKRKIHFLLQQVFHHKTMLGDMENVFRQLELRLHLGKAHLFSAVTTTMQEKERQLREIFHRLQQELPAGKIALQEHHMNLLVLHLKNSIARILEQKQAAFTEQAALLHGVSPLATLARGYAIVRKQSNQGGYLPVVTKAAETEVGDELNILLGQGQLECVVTGVSSADAFIPGSEEGLPETKPSRQQSSPRGAAQTPHPLCCGRG